MTAPAAAVTRRPVGEIIRRELASRNWTQADFAGILNRPPQFVSEVITGKKAITRESAAQIAAALGNTPDHWLELQNEYQLAELANDEDTQKKLSEIRQRAQSLKKVTVAEHQRVLAVLTAAQLRKALRGTALPTLPVCDACLRASCVQGVFYCEQAKGAGTIKKTVAQLTALDLESPDYWVHAL